MRLILFTLAGLSLGTAQAAVTETARTGYESPSSSTGLRLELGFNLYNYDYKEDVTPPRKSTESGILPGVDAAVKYAFPSTPLFSELQSTVTLATTEYDGTTFSGRPLTKTTRANLIDARGLLGVTVATPSPSNRLQFYSGVGWRFWQRSDGSGIADSSRDYREDYSWFYVPIGMRIENRLSERVELDLDLSLKIPFASKIKVYFAQTDEGFPDFEADLGNKPGYRIQAPLRWKIKEPWTLIFTPWLEYSAIGQSDPVLVINDLGEGLFLQEPDSTTYQFGTVFSVSFTI